MVVSEIVGKDKKAINLLKRYNLWNSYQKRVLTEEDIKYCIEKGVMYENLTITHQEAVDEIKTLANSITIEEAAEAFLYSLSSGSNPYRTVLSSVVWGRSLEKHTTDSMDRITPNHCVCDICNLSLEKDGKRCNTNLNGYSRFRYFSGEQDICEAGYVLLDLREYKKLPKVTHCEEDIRILNRIFGLAQELGPANKSIALQKLITTEKFFKATKNEINCILGVLAICGVFDTPEKKSVATKFVPNSQRNFVMESDLFYPLNYWRGKYGINYQAVEKIFGNVVGKQLNKEESILGEVKRNQPEKTKQSKAEQYFTEGKHFVELANKDRYYYGMNELNPAWDKITRFSVTHNCYKRSEIYFEGDVIKKMIYEENRGGKRFSYKEIDMEVATEERKLVLPKTARGRKQTLTPTLLMTPTYMKEQLGVELSEGVWSYNSANDQYLPLPPDKVSNNEEFQEYTQKYIKDLPADYDELIDNFRNKERVTVKFHAGAVFRMQLTPKKCTYGLLLGKVREILKWQEVPENHPLHRCMTQPVLFRQYDIVTENKNMTIEELENIPLRSVTIAQDNDILWETYPIIGYKKLKERDIDLGFSLYKNRVVLGLGIYDYEEDLFPDLEKNHDHQIVSLAIHGYETIPDYIMKNIKVREEVEKRLGLNHETAIDEFAKRYGGITRKKFIELIEEREKK